ncbi:MAG TPA: hypothetical protein DCZ20_00690 [Lachnospiraceae bacterium]|nr:hypothetical protein [Lachnospiraceae bacterium]
MLLIKNAEIHTVTDGILERGDILVSDGKIQEVKEQIDVSDLQDVEIIDAEGCCVLPGFIDCHTHIGLQNRANPMLLGDITEITDPVTPDEQVIDGVDISLKEFSNAWKNGVTSVGILPGSANVINGLGFAAKTYGDNIYDMCMKNPVGFKVAFGENPKGLYGPKFMRPTSRMGVITVMEEYLYDAKAYMDAKEAALEKGEEFKENPEYEAAIPVLKREIPIRLHCTHNDMATAADITKEYGIRTVIEHAWGADHYLNELADVMEGVVYGPIGGKRTFFESRRTDVSTVAELDRRGLTVAVTTDSPILSLNSLINMAEEAVRQGTPIDRAERMITINPAKILGVEDRVGSIEPGKDADLVIWKHVPLRDMDARICHVIGGGKVLL